MLTSCIDCRLLPLTSVFHPLTTIDYHSFLLTCTFRPFQTLFFLWRAHFPTPFFLQILILGFICSFEAPKSHIFDHSSFCMGTSYVKSTNSLTCLYTIHVNVSLVTFATIIGLSSHFLVTGVAIFRCLQLPLAFISGFLARFLPQCAPVIQGHFNVKVYQGLFQVISFMVTYLHQLQCTVLLSHVPSLLLHDSHHALKTVFLLSYMCSALIARALQHSFHVHHVLHGFMGLFLFDGDPFQTFSLRGSYFMQFQIQVFVILHLEFEGGC